MFLQGNTYAILVCKINNHTYLVNSIIPNEFKEFIDKALDKREKEYVMMKGIKVIAKPEFARLFLNPKTDSSKLNNRKPFACRAQRKIPPFDQNFQKEKMG